jgi:hypothetical protein
MVTVPDRLGVTAESPQSPHHVAFAIGPWE